MKITPQEKLILYNQYEILKHLNPNDFSYYEEKQGILEYGSENDCEELLNFLDGTPNEVASKVFDILEMFSALTFSYDKLTDVTGLDRKDVLFSGFDGNYECDYYSYTKFLIDIRNRYQEFKECELNSHCRNLDWYHKMLERFNAVKQKRETQISCCNMTLEEIKEIIGK